MYMNKNGALCFGADGTTEMTCPVCGSNRIEDTGSEEHDGDEYTGYGFKCLVCGAGGYKNYIRAFDGYVVTEIPGKPAGVISANDIREVDAGKLMEMVSRIIAERDAAIMDLKLLNDGSDHTPCETCLFGNGREPDGPDCESCCAPECQWVWRGTAKRPL